MNAVEKSKSDSNITTKNQYIMKKFLICAIAALAFAGFSSAEAKEPQKSVIKTVVFDTDVYCPHCAKKILDNAALLGKGVKDVQVDVPTKKVTVKFDESKSSVEDIVKGMAKLRVKAEPEKTAK